MTPNDVAPQVKVVQGASSSFDGTTLLGIACGLVGLALLAYAAWTWRLLAARHAAAPSPVTEPIAEAVGHPLDEAIAEPIQAKAESKPELELTDVDAPAAIAEPNADAPALEASDAMFPFAGTLDGAQAPEAAKVAAPSEAVAAAPVVVTAPILVGEPVAVVEAPVVIAETAPVVAHEPTGVPVPVRVIEPFLTAPADIATAAGVVAAPIAIPEAIQILTPMAIAAPVVIPERIVVAAPIVIPAPIDLDAPLVMPEPVRAYSPADRFGPAPTRDVIDEIRDLDRAMARAFSHSAEKTKTDDLALPMDDYPPVAGSGEPEFKSALSRALLGDD